MRRPESGSYPEYYERYISKVATDDLISTLLTEHYDTIDLITSVDLETQHFRYAEGKWNMLEIIQHLIDSERIFAFRALSIARGETQVLPGFDENAYAVESHAAKRNMNDLAREFSVVRASTVELLKSMSDEMVERSGMANGKPITVAALFYIIAGHELHHRNIIEERYIS